MAPLNRGRAQTRHTDRGRGFRPGQRNSRGRGGNTSAPRSGKSVRFNTTRIEDKVGSDEEDSGDNLPNKSDLEETSNRYLSDEEEVEPEEAHFKPYDI